MSTETKFTFAEFKRQLEPGMVIKRSFFENGDLIGYDKRVVSSVTSGGFCTRDEELGTLSEMRFGKASEWTFDTYIAGRAAIWTDPENPAYQTQYVYVERGLTVSTETVNIDTAQQLVKTLEAEKDDDSKRIYVQMVIDGDEGTEAETVYFPLSTCQALAVAEILSVKGTDS